MLSFSCCSSPFGTLLIGCDRNCVVSIGLGQSFISTDSPEPAAALAARELTEYFEGRRKCFDFPIQPQGTPFQLAVWEALTQVPYGETRTYAEIAAMIGKPNASRAVGMACNRNPVWIAIPCHRVVGSDNALTGYAGGLDMKRTLLDLEQHNR